jgi:hypothetical protein
MCGNKLDVIMIPKVEGLSRFRRAASRHFNVCANLQVVLVERKWEYD